MAGAIGQPIGDLIHMEAMSDFNNQAEQYAASGMGQAPVNPYPGMDKSQIIQAYLKKLGQNEDEWGNAYVNAKNPETGELLRGNNWYQDGMYYTPGDKPGGPLGGFFAPAILASAFFGLGATGAAAGGAGAGASGGAAGSQLPFGESAFLSQAAPSTSLAVGSGGASTGFLMPPAGMPPAIAGAETSPFLSASGNAAYQFGTPEALSSSFGLGAPGIGMGGTGIEAQFKQLLDAGLSPDLAMQMMQTFNGGAPGATLMEGAGANTFGSVAGAGSGPMGSGGMGSWFDELKKKLMKPGGGDFSNLFGIGSGLYGMVRGNSMDKMAQSAMTPRITDMLGYGARAPYLQQLNALMSDPSSIDKMPGYKAGMDAVTRSMAKNGYLGSGNMMTSMAKYGGDFFNQEIARLMGLSGYNLSPAVTGGPGAAAAFSAAGNNTISAALAALGYTARNMEK